MGANLIVHWADISAFQFAMQAALGEIKQALGDQSAAGAAKEETI
jgi:hypothetical protein